MANEKVEKEMKPDDFYKHPKFGQVYGNPLVSPTGRCAWPALVKPQDPPPPKPGEQPGAPRYGLTIILPKDDVAVKAFVTKVNRMAAMMLQRFNAGRKAKLTPIEQVLADGDNFDQEKYPYYKNSWLLIARNAKKPPIVDGAKSELPPEAIQGGMFVRATVTPLVTGSGISYRLEALQRVRDDEVRFGGANRAGSYVDMIPPVEESEEQQAEAQAAIDSAEETNMHPTPEGELVKVGKAKALSML